jgi:membrane protein YdbS with pleckstrin-like domain
MKKRKYLIKVRKSRKSFFILYLMMFFVLGFLAYLWLNGNGPEKIALISGIIFIILLIKYIEISVWKDWWAITENSLIQSTGILDKNVREIDFSSISDLDLDQAFFKRVLNYGNVNVRLFINETSIKIININKPRQFIDELQRLISKSRRGKDGIREI